MKKSLDEIAYKLSQVLHDIPQNFALENAKLYVKKAINEINSVEIKRQKRKTEQQREIQLIDYNTAKLAIKEIDKLIEIERKNLENKPESKDMLFSD